MVRFSFAGSTGSVFLRPGNETVIIVKSFLAGQFLSSGVSVDTAKKLLQVPKRTDPIPVLKAPVWDTVEDKEYRGRHCWYPTNGTSVLEGMSYDYIIEHILSTKFKFSEFVSS